MQKLPIYWILFVSQLLFIPYIKGQNNYGCKDTTKIQYGFICDYSNINPVCGCDNNTWVNSDCALYTAGIQISTNGICGNSEMYLIGNMLNPMYPNLKCLIFTKLPDIPFIQIYDDFGRLFYEGVYYTDANIGLKVEIPLSGLRTGLYLAVLLSSNDKKVKKFVVFNE